MSPKQRAKAFTRDKKTKPKHETLRTAMHTRIVVDAQVNLVELYRCLRRVTKIQFRWQVFNIPEDDNSEPNNRTARLQYFKDASIVTFQIVISSKSFPPLVVKHVSLVASIVFHVPLLVTMSENHGDSNARKNMNNICRHNL